MKKDIQGRGDIELLIVQFYEKVKKDPVIGYIFNDIAQVNWEKHLPVMFDFWENLLFYTGGYNGNPMTVHKQLHRIVPLNPEHFKRWEELFFETVDECFEGENASMIKKRAANISAVMQYKIIHEGGLLGKN